MIVIIQKTRIFKPIKKISQNRIQKILMIQIIFNREILCLVVVQNKNLNRIFICKKILYKIIKIKRMNWKIINQFQLV